MSDQYGFDLGQIKRYIVRPALQVMGPQYASNDAVNLVLGTGAAETQYRYVAQLDGGPARSPWQMEEATFIDIAGRYLPAQQFKLWRMLTTHYGVSSLLPLWPDMTWDLCLAAIMCRIRYLPAYGAIPSDAEGQCGYWKKFYNTSLGAGNLDKLHVGFFRDAIVCVG